MKRRTQQTTVTRPGTQTDIRRATFILLCKELNRYHAVRLKDGGNAAGAEELYDIGQPGTDLVLKKGDYGSNHGRQRIGPDAILVIVRSKHDRMRIGLTDDEVIAVEELGELL